MIQLHSVLLMRSHRKNVQLILGGTVAAAPKTQRIRDPVHGLIVFESEGDGARIDQTAWKLIDTPEFQRLRRIKQLGVSEFTFPGALHSRFSHSIGVFHNARGLIEVLKRLIPAPDYNDDRAKVAIFAALLHDVGHGPFSHAFENVQKARGAERSHEEWTAEIIQNPDGGIRPILEKFRRGLSDEIAELLRSDNPKDVFHAVVSSSLDADRLDYLRRDRLMTGSGAGAIDFDWIMDNVRIADISLSGDEEELDAPTVKTFCLDEKATQAAEQFLLSRYHLFQQVYLHKTTRGIEACITDLLDRVANAAQSGDHDKVGLDDSNPLIRFFVERGASIANYLALDDMEIWTALARIADGEDQTCARLADRLRKRELLRCLDIDIQFPAKPNEPADDVENRRQAAISRIDEICAEMNITVLKDASPISAYGEVGADQTKAHKMMSILMRDGSRREITQLAPSIKAIVKKRSIVRYYFERDSDRSQILAGVTING